MLEIPETLFQDIRSTAGRNIEESDFVVSGSVITEEQVGDFDDLEKYVHGREMRIVEPRAEPDEESDFPRMFPTSSSPMPMPSAPPAGSRYPGPLSVNFFFSGRRPVADLQAEMTVEVEVHV